MDIKKLLHSFKFAANGILLAVRDGQNMKIHLGMGLLALFLSWWLCISKMEFLLIVSVIFLVLSLETLNTSIEKMVDEVSLERRPNLAAIKDMAAGAVLLAAVLSVILGVFIFIPKAVLLFK